MSTSLATVQPLGTDIEKVLLGGDLSPLTPDQRLNYYNRICESLGLNPLTKPFAYITLNGKLQLYALKDCTEQLRKIHGVSITSVDPKQIGDLLVVVAAATDREGRVDSSTGAVNVKGVTGENLANAMMKCETKAKRRVTLSICGLGMLDETEIDTLKEQGVAREPAENKWEAPPVQSRTAAPAVNASMSESEIRQANVAPPSGEPDIRPRSQKGAQPPTQTAQAAPSPSGEAGGAVQGQVVGSEPVITEKQRKMFFAISRSAGLDDEQVKKALAGINIHCHRDSIPKARFQDALRAIDPQFKFHTDQPK
jgi:hypothetical protein